MSQCLEIRRVLRNVTLLITCLLLAACATKPINMPHYETGTRLDSWEISGRIAFSDEKEKFSATLNWQQHPSQFKARLSKVLGGTLMRMESNQGLTWMEVDGKTYRGYDATELVELVFGWQIPFQQLPDWLQGIDNNSTQLSNVERDEKGNLLSFTSPSGWQVKYRSYVEQQGLRLPQNLAISRDGVNIKLRINEWRQLQSEQTL